jgi:hypothetical protein
MSNDRTEWEKDVDKAAKKFRDQAFKAVYQYHGSTYSYEAADVLAAAYAALVKGKDMKEAEKQVFTQEFLDKLATNDKEATKQ